MERAEIVARSIVNFPALSAKSCRHRFSHSLIGINAALGVS